MFIVRMAELNILIENKYKYTENMCKDYITEGYADFSVSVSDDEISAENHGISSDGYSESLAVYRKIAEKIIDYNGFLLHSAVIEAEGCGIAFLAASGVGKSTHTALWLKLLHGKATVINGDKPLIRIKGGKPFAYGTPWAGKENLHTNTKTELKKICFIERSEKNECILFDKKSVLSRLLNQIYIPKKSDKLLKLLELVNILSTSADFYLIKCNTDISAAETAYNTIIT